MILTTHPSPRHGLYVSLFSGGTRPVSPFHSSSSRDRQTRKPTVGKFVSHQMLCGSCGSAFIQLLSDTTRAALRRSFARLLKWPPRATCDHLFSVGRKAGDRTKPSVSRSRLNRAESAAT